MAGQTLTGGARSGVAAAAGGAATDLRAATSRALRWSVAARLGAQLVSWASTLIVIRLLDPHDYGLVAMAMIVISFAALFNDVGVSTSVIRSPELTLTELATLRTLNVLANLGLFCLVLAAAPAVSWLFAADLTAVTAALALTFLLRCVGAIPEALLIRSFEFRKRSLVEMASTLGGSVSALGLALAGTGVWALVLGQIATAAIRAVGFSLAAPASLGWRLEWGCARPHLRFGGWISLQRLLWWAYTQADVFLLARLAGPAAVGAYAVAKNLAFLPTNKLGSVLNTLALTTYAHVQGDPGRFLRAFRQGSALLATTTFPLFWLVAALAPELQAVLLGPDWAPVADPMRTLAFVVPFFVLATQVGEALNAKGKVREVVKYLGILLATTGGGSLAGVAWGATGVAVGWAAGYMLGWVSLCRIGSRELGVPASAILKTGLAPLTAAAAGFVVVALLRPLAPDAALLRLVALAAAFACPASLLLLAFDRDAVRDVARFLLK